MRRHEIDRRARREPAPVQYVNETHWHRRSHAEILAGRDGKFDGKSFKGLALALEQKRRQGDRP